MIRRNGVPERSTQRRLDPMMIILAAALAAAAPAPVEPTLDEVRTATMRFKDVKVALAEGYVADPTNTCHVAEHMGQAKSLGGMGIHYFRPDLLGINSAPTQRVSGDAVHTDFRKPAILIYEPNATGELELIAVENLVFEKAWKAAGKSKAPTYQGVSWDRMADDPATPVDEAHGFEPHYDLHVWLYRDNPSGMFKPFNPRVTCAFAEPSKTAHAGREGPAAQQQAGHAGH
jgi:hypothetical protein